eukprot:7659976-Pyramimonas_sp.AAC.1
MLARATSTRTVLAFPASLPAGEPVMVFGYLPTRQGRLRMTAASRLSPAVHLALQFFISHHIRIETVVTVGLARGTHGLPAALCADSCALVSPWNFFDITGAAHARVIQCFKPSKPSAGFDADISKFEDLADASTTGGRAQEEGRPLAPTALDELQEETQQLETPSWESLCSVPAEMVADDRALVAVAIDEQGH